MPDKPTGSDQFWAWVHKNVTGEGIIWFLVVIGWMTYLVASAD